MSKVKALKKLRAAGRNLAKGRNLENHEECNMLLVLADEIEAEIAERFMELPVDADGIPIRVGDYLQLGDTRGEVVALTYCPSDGKFPWEWQCDTGGWHKTAFACHANPRTVEDVLRDVWKEALDYAKSDMWRNPDEVFAERADEIRAMFGEVGE